ncbi:MAG: tRNA (adenosine(37)-N6)-threonylcarbamoyltransferase complex ATPase subunit type 1 TsaE [Chthoniobacterales bacterium]
MAIFTSNSAVETEEIGRRFAGNVKPGDVLALTGELGSGKTQFVKGLVAGLGGSDAVTSPTFTLIHEYSRGRMPIYHFDFFRVEDRQSAKRLGLDDYFFGDGVSVIEWADRFPDLIPRNAHWISFQLKSETERAINFQGSASRPPFEIDGGLETAAP